MFFKVCTRNKWFSTQKLKPFYITTPIFYVNAAPHIGHLYSAVIADATFRFEKLLKTHNEYHFITGTDEHGSKIQQAADLNKVSTINYCNQISQEYRNLFKNANISNTDYIRTTEDRHKKAVSAFWLALKNNDAIYTTQYSGWYCIPDETFLTETQLKVLDNGKKVSIESGHPVEWTQEENYMFKLTKYQEDILYWIKKGDRIKPKKFENILLDMLKDPLPDVSISRPTTRVHWGINVPDDKSQTIYVWLDALVNYLTCAGYPNTEYGENWPPSLQVIGKDILKFHGIYWPAFLIAAGLEPPNQLLVHSHWTVNGEKMSKSKLNVINPVERSNIYSYDGIRYFLLREGTNHSDANYSDVKVMRILNSELADTLGNLLSRGCAKQVNVKQIIPNWNQRVFDDELLQLDVTKKLVNLINELPDKCFEHYKAYNFYLVVDHIIEVLHVANKFFETTKPWELRKKNEIEKLNCVLSCTLEILRICGIILQPIIPELSKKLLDKLCIDDKNRYWKNLESVLWRQQQLQQQKQPNEIFVAENLLNTHVDAILFRRIRADAIEIHHKKQIENL